MKSGFLKDNIFPLLVVCVSVLTAGIAFFFLPEKIPMQWNDTSVIWYADRIAIFLAPVISAFVILLLRPLIDFSLRNYLILIPKLSGIIISGITLILFSCELYTIAFSFGVRLNIVLIISLEFLALAVISLLYSLRSKVKTSKATK